MTFDSVLSSSSRRRSVVCPVRQSLIWLLVSLISLKKSLK
jgi:hypothetical protein